MYPSASADIIMRIRSSFTDLIARAATMNIAKILRYSIHHGNAVAGLIAVAQVTEIHAANASTSRCVGENQRPARHLNTTCTSVPRIVATATYSDHEMPGGSAHCHMYCGLRTANR